MHRSERLKLRFGSYDTPQFKYGATVWDEVRGDVAIVGLSAGRIPWPIGKKPGVRGRSLVVYHGLLRAIQREAGPVVRHWFGVTQYTYQKWKRELGIVGETEGTKVLRRLYMDGSQGVKARRAGRKTLSSPERAAKIAAAMRGKRRPKWVIAKVAAAMRGKRRSAETRLKMSKAQKRIGTRPPAVSGPAWTKAEDALLATLPDRQVAERIGRSVSACRQRRWKLRPPD